MTAQSFSAPLETLRKRVQEATQRLLGDTIGIAEPEWNAPSRLPGWSRAQVAAHVAANADALARLIEAVLQGAERPLYPDPEARLADIERGSMLTGLELQILLDTSAGNLERALDDVSDWTTPVQLAGRPLTFAQLPLARLAEVSAHHLDLDCGFSTSRIDESSARWLLQWGLLWHGEDPDLPAVRMESGSGITADVGTDGGARPVLSGSDADLWAWLIGRATSDDLAGDPDVGSDLPAPSPRS